MAADPSNWPVNPRRRLRRRRSNSATYSTSMAWPPCSSRTKASRRGMRVLSASISVAASMMASSDTMKCRFVRAERTHTSTG